MPPPSITYAITLVDEGAIPVPFDQRALFGKARPPVIVSIGAHSYHSTIAIMSGVTFVPLRRSNREAAGVGVGDTFDVTLTLDTAPREVPLPDDLGTAIDQAGRRADWDTLSFTTRRELAEGVEEAKRTETRVRRIDAVIERLNRRAAS